jgi:hypothetical protein
LALAADGEAGVTRVGSATNYKVLVVAAARVREVPTTLVTQNWYRQIARPTR